MKKYIDLHAHPFKEYFDSPQDIIEESHLNGIDTMMLVGTCVEDSQEVKELAAKHTYTFPVIGIHPNSATNPDDLIELRNLVDKTIVGIGEIGFDFHYDDSPSRAQQEIFFRYQVELALEFEIPVVIHCRDATQETFDLLKEYKEQNPKMQIIIHSYSSGPDWVDNFLSIGAYLSFSGVVTFKNAKDIQEAARITPIDRIFYETDTPYLSPMPMRGKVNKPSYAIHTAKFIANLKQIDVEELNEQVNKNVEMVFQLKKRQRE